MRPQRLPLIALLMWGGLATAQPNPQPPAPAARQLDLEPELVRGDHAAPHGDLTRPRARRAPPSLIRIRVDFRRALLSSAERL